MQIPITYPSTRRRRPFGVALMLLLAAFIVFGTEARAQLSGTYTVGSGGNYSSIQAAIDALNASGVSGPVTFRINAGTYTAPSTGYTLRPVTGMSATNTVTFKPAAGATVLITGQVTTGRSIFRIDNGDYYIIDGSNSVGGTSRDMTIRQTDPDFGFVIKMVNDADYNVLKNCKLEANNGGSIRNTTDGGAIVMIGELGSLYGNDSNTVQSCLVGDPTGTMRCGTGIYVYGGSLTAMNVGTKVLDNELVNLGQNTGGSATAGQAFYLFISYYNTGAIVRGNKLHMTQPCPFNVIYGIYINESLGNSQNVTVDRNQIYDLRHNGGAGNETIANIYYTAGSATNSTTRFTNNFIAANRSSASTTYYGLYAYLSPSTNCHLHVYNNSFYLAGSGNFAYMFILQTASSVNSTFTHKNNVYHSTWTSGAYAHYVTPITGWTSDNNLIEFNTSNGSAYHAYYGSSVYKSFSEYKSAAAPNEVNTISGNPQFVNPTAGDLHIDPIKPTPVEAAGVPITGVTTDIDGNPRSTTRPDLGADEGNFNGGGLRLTTPNGGELILAGASMTATFMANRPMTVSVDFSTNNGATWSQVAGVNAIVGPNTVTFNAPDVATTSARVRVVNNVNEVEGDSSDGVFTLVRPSLTLIDPNGGQRFVEGETVPIRWSSQDMPSNRRVMLEYSVNGGRTWSLIATNLTSANLPATNTYNWALPALRTDSGMVRVSMVDRPVSDASDRYFSVFKGMNLLSPNGGEVFYVGERKMIKWSVFKTNYVRLDYSTDGGATWTMIASKIPYYLDSLEWIVPNTPTNQALVRLSNSADLQYNDISDANFSIVRSELQLTSPNGGERYNLNEAVTVSWMSQNVSTVRVEYSFNNGATWVMAADAVPASNGSVTFTPPGIPTRTALVRITNAERPTQSDRSDGLFEIMEEPSITVFTPSQGEKITRGTSYMVTWQAHRIARVNIEYSANGGGGGGGGWQRLASNVDASMGTYMWTVPMSTTTNGRIRVVDVDSDVMGMSGTFSIVEQIISSLSVIAPNGGEKYTEGETITIRWSANNVQQLNLLYSTDGGTTWSSIANRVDASLGRYDWTAPAMPGTNYRVRVVSTGANDNSDESFEIMRRITPSLTLIYPNGGENLMVGTTAAIRWTSSDVTGDVDVNYSTDNGATWKPVGTVPAASGELNWTIPNEPTDQALVQVSAGATKDQSDATFEITPKPVARLRVVSPNGGETWRTGERHDIEWDAENVSVVRIQYSIDGGVNWINVTTAPASPNSYNWSIPNFTSATPALVRISDDSDAQTSDVSDASFTLSPAGAGVTGGTIAGELRTLGSFPNPFSVETRIRWTQPTAGMVDVRVYEMNGRLMQELAAGYRDAGEQGITLGSAGLPSGIYVYEIRSGGRTARGTVVVAR